MITELKSLLPPRTCWYKNSPAGLWYKGTVLTWSIDFEELNIGIGHYPVAIVEDTNNSIKVIPATFISFSEKEP
jgi:hypothetical protein